MYIHFYTETPKYSHVYTEKSKDTDIIKIYWYATQTEDVDLFRDIETMFKLMKEYNIVLSYTGDILKVKDVNQFQQTMILLGTTEKNTSSITLNDGSFIQVYSYESMFKGAKMNDIIDVCISQYEGYETFADTNDPFIPNDNFIADGHIYYSMSLNNTRVFNMGKAYKRLQVRSIQSRIDPKVLALWFYSFIKKSEYSTAYHMLIKLIDTKLDDSNEVTIVDDGRSVQESVVETVMEDQQPNIEWIRLFCTLYMESSTEDTLVSVVYADYCTASKWANCEPVSMKHFIRMLRDQNKYQIKRRAKGMMVIGYTSIVSQQKIFAIQTSKLERIISCYMIPKEIDIIIKHNHELISSIQHPYTREACLLLRSMKPQITKEIVKHFCANPYIQKQLQEYSKYIDDMLNFDSTKNVGNLSNILTYRRFDTNFNFYYPFALETRDLGLLSNNIESITKTATSSFNAMTTYEDFMPYCNHQTNYEVPPGKIGAWIAPPFKQPVHDLRGVASENNKDDILTH